MLQEHRAVARVLAVEQIGQRQRRERAERDVVQVADRRRDQIEPGAQGLRQQRAQLLGDAARRG
jgi:hypothetical protein